MVSLVLELIEAGVTLEEIVQHYYPQLTQQDVAACAREGAR